MPSAPDGASSSAANGTRSTISADVLRELQSVKQELTSLKNQSKLDKKPYDDYFYGNYGDNFNEFHEHFELDARARQLTDAQKVVRFPACLRGNALYVYGQLTPQEQGDYTLLIPALEAKFHSKHMRQHYCRELHKRKQRTGEIVPVFANELEKLAKLAYPLTATFTDASRKGILKQCFLAGLSEDLQEKMSHQPEPDSFEAARDTAQQYEARNIFRPSSRLLDAVENGVADTDEIKRTLKEQEQNIKSLIAATLPTKEHHSSNVQDAVTAALAKQQAMFTEMFSNLQMSSRQQQPQVNAIGPATTHRNIEQILRESENRTMAQVQKLLQQNQRPQHQQFQPQYDYPSYSGNMQQGFSNYRGHRGYTQSSRGASRGGFGRSRPSGSGYRRDHRWTVNGDPICHKCQKPGHMGNMCPGPGPTRFGTRAQHRGGRATTFAALPVTDRRDTDADHGEEEEGEYNIEGAQNDPSSTELPGDYQALLRENEILSEQVRRLLPSSYQAVCLPVGHQVKSTAEVDTEGYEESVWVGGQYSGGEYELPWNSTDTVDTTSQKGTTETVEHYRNAQNEETPKRELRPHARNCHFSRTQMSLLAWSFFGLAVFALFTVVHGVTANPMICQTKARGMIWKVPEAVACTMNAAQNDSTQTVSMMIYKRNHIQYRSKAWSCSKVKSTVETKMWFFGDETRKRDKTEYLPVPGDECAQMKLWQKCSVGPLVNKGGLWQTETKLKWSYEWCCRWYTFTNTRCFMSQAHVYKKHGEEAMESDVGQTGHCEYGSGKCQLKDGSFLIWNVNTTEACEYLEWQIMEGQQWGSNWLSSDGNLALTMTNQHSTTDCKGNKIEISDQGIGYRVLKRRQQRSVLDTVVRKISQRRHRRDARNINPDKYYSQQGLVTTDLLAASLQALQTDIAISAKQSFAQAMHSTCSSMQTVTKVLQAEMFANPTLAMRALTNRGDIYARSSGSVIETFPCQELRTVDIMLLPMNSSEMCYKEIPMKFVVQNMTHTGYLDSTTNIIHKEGMPTDCDSVGNTPVQLDGKSFTYSPQTGKLTEISQFDILSAFQYNWTTNLGLWKSSTIFHQVVIYNWTDLQTHISMNDIFSGVATHQRILEELSSGYKESPTANSLTQGIMNRGLFGFLTGLSFSPKQLWIFAVCVYVTLAALVFHCCPGYLRLQNLNAHTGLSRVRNWLRGDNSTDQQQQTVNQPGKSQLEVRWKNETVELEARSGTEFVPWPPRRVNVTNCREGESAELPVVCAKIDGIRIQSLFDTGSSVTIIHKSVLEKDRKLNPCIVPAVQSITENSMAFLGSVQVQIQLGGCTVLQTAHVTDRTPYNCIIGMDCVSKFGLLSMDTKHKNLYIGGKPVPYSFSSQTDRPSVNHIRPVVLNQEVTLPPRSQVLTEGKVDGNRTECISLLVEPRHSPKLNDKGVKLGRSVSRSKQNILPVCLLNLATVGVVLGAGTLLGCATSQFDLPPTLPTTACATATTAPTLTDSSFLSKLNFANSNLTPQQQNRLSGLLVKHQDAFSKDEYDIGFCKTVVHRIPTGSHPPIKQRHYRIPYSDQAEAKQMLDSLEERGIIQKSQSPWASPMVLVRKKDGKLRLCVDYRRLNAITRKDVFPLPRIDETLDSLGGASYFTSLDMSHSFFQCDLHPRDRAKSTFSSMFGSYSFNRCPQGTCNSVSTLQRGLQHILAGLQWRVCTIFCDDCLIYSRTFDEHLKHVEEVLIRLKEAGFKLKLPKCQFARSSVPYLGHNISKDGLRPQAAKIATVTHWPIPSNVKEVRQFLGFASYYRRFIENFATIATPLHRLTGKTKDKTKKPKKSDFKWTVECETAFQTLIQKLTSAPVLAFPDQRLPFIVHTDASDFGIGAALHQKINGVEKPVAYISRVLSKAERNYTTTEKECLAVVWAIKSFSHYLHGNEFTVVTDHAALKWLQTAKHEGQRLMRWTLSLQCYNFKIEHRPGRSHGNADGLSRIPPTGPQVNCATDMAIEQQKDDEIVAMYKFLTEKTEPTDQKLRDYIVKYANQFSVDNGKVYRRCRETRHGVTTDRQQLVVPKHLISDILKMLHDGPCGGHFGVQKTLAKIRERYFWPTQTDDVKKWCKSCLGCALYKRPQKYIRVPMKPIATEGPMDRMAMDIIGPLKPTEPDKFRYILVCVDYFSKWAEAYPMKDQKATTVAEKLVSELFPRFGAPKIILSDNGQQFRSVLIQQVCDLLAINKIFTSPWRPQTDGFCEKVNGIVGRLLAQYCDSENKHWDKCIPLALLAYRTSIQASTKQTPYFLMYGRDCRLPQDVAELELAKPTDDSYVEYAKQLMENLSNVYEAVRDQLQKAHIAQKKFYDRGTEPAKLTVGQLIMEKNRVKQGAKLKPKWKGPYRILELTETNAHIRSINSPQAKVRIVHLNSLKAFDPGATKVVPGEESDSTDDSVQSEPDPYELNEMGLEEDEAEN